MAEDDRRRLLHATDDLLERIEQLRLREIVQLPHHLHATIAGIAAEVGEHSRAPATLADAHDSVFRLQARILRGDRPQSARPLSGAAPAAPVAPTIPPLSLPPRQGFAPEVGWLEQVRLVLQRAHDRASYLHAQAQAARRRPGTASKALATRRGAEAEEALRNFEELSLEAEQATGRSIALDPLPTIPSSGRLQLEDLVIDIDSGQAHQAGRAIQLTPYEHAYLVVLAANHGRALTREAMQHLVSGDEPTLPVRSRTLDVHVSRLRAKLGQPAYIETISGVGYRATARQASGAPPAAALDHAREQRRAERRAWARGSSASPPAPSAASVPPIERRAGR